MSTFKFPVSEQADRSESEHAGFVTQMRLVSLPEMAKPVTACERTQTVIRHAESSEL
jgi:hypothetical protein